MLVVTQVAISLVLLNAAGMLGRSLSNLEQRELGFEAGGRYILPINTMVSAYSRDEIDRIVPDIERRLRSIPGVTSANVVLYAPMSGIVWTHDVAAEDALQPVGDATSHWSRITPGFFHAAGVPLVSGREFTDGDDGSAPLVAIINQSFARRFFGSGNVIGKRFGPEQGTNGPTFEVVGVISDMRYNAYWDSIRPMYFVPHAQGAQFDDSKLQNREVWSHYPYNVFVWARGNPHDLEVLARRAIADAAPRVVTFGLRPYREIIRDAYAQENMIASLTGLFGMVALILAAVGLYGVIAYAVAQRTTEIGVRRALGARARSILGGVLGEAFSQIGIGVALGIPASLAVGRLIGNRLYGVGPSDWILLVQAALLLAVAAALAAAIPAHRAAAVSPMAALRSE